jgi:Family of unknown function (DUF6159)
LKDNLAMTRIQRGWELTKESWAVVRSDRSLLAFPVLAALSALLVAAIFVGGGVALHSSTDSEPLLIVVLVIGAYVLVAVSIFFNVALSACAARALEGQDTTTAEGFAAARGRFGQIIGWAGVQLVVGALISIIQALLREGAGAIIGAIIGGLASFAWNIATFFVIPAIALEGLGPMDALKRSVAVIRQRWGEGVTGSFAIGGLIFLVAFLPGVALVAGGIALTSSSDALAGILIALGVAIFVVGAVLQAALMAIFKVALFRFATEDKVLGNYDRGQLEAAFVPRSGRAGTI